jgi:hypothetical protein
MESVETRNFDRGSFERGSSVVEVDEGLDKEVDSDRQC